MRPEDQLMAELMMQQGRTTESVAQLLGLSVEQVETVRRGIRPPAVVWDHPEPPLVLSDALKSWLREIVNEDETFDFVRSSRDSRSGVITMEIEFDELISKLLPAAMDGAV